MKELRGLLGWSVLGIVAACGTDGGGRTLIEDGSDGATLADTSIVDDATTATTTTTTTITDATTTPTDTTGTTQTDTGTDTLVDHEVVFVAEHPRVWLDAEVRARLEGLLAAEHPAATRFRDMVDAQVYDGADWYEFSAPEAALMFQLTGTQAYCDDAVAQTEAFVVGEEALIGAGQRADVAYDSYLYVGPIIGDLALVYDWCFDTLTPAQRARWLAYAHQAVWNVWHPEEATWGGASHPWTGWGTDNPANNYYYSFLRATMLFGLAARDEHPEAAGWVEHARTTKLEGELFPLFTRDLAGGGSREGTGYGVAMKELFTLYDFWHHSTGEPIADRTPHTRESLAYMLHAIVPTGDYLAPLGDHARDSTAEVFDYHRHYLLALRAFARGTPLAEIATTLLDTWALPEMARPNGFFVDFAFADDAIASRPLADLGRAYRGAGTGHVFWRSSWAPDASYLTFVCGPYTESHAHRDQGSFMFYGDGWLAHDANFHSHSGIVQDEIAHNLVRLVGPDGLVRQRAGTTSTLLALADRGDVFYVAGDLTPAYGGADAVTQHRRGIVVVAPDVVVVFDRVDVAADVRATWHLTSPLAPTLSGGRATLADAQRTLGVRPIHPVPGSGGATLTSVAWPDADGDMSGGHRLDLAAPTGPQTFLVLLDRGGVVTNATADDADGQVGVALDLTGGRGARVRFDLATARAHVELRQGAAVLRTLDLEAAVEPLPLYAP